uniref:Putative RNA-binding protein Raly n=1 Tax=Schistosoma japonicum TaxID=6182 RepID=C1LET5_SCHJA|nr:putative RNA-binding protein Raly [Schistosoma japonicum]
MIGVSNITNRTDPNSLKSRVFVGNLNTVHMSKTELESIFSKYGAVVGISVHKGYAFIQYANETNARAAVIGEDSKTYYNMVLDVTIASEPKNRKRGRSNVSSSLTSWNPLSSTNLSDLALQAHALSNMTSNSVLSLQQFGLEGIMGQPNLINFAAAANSVFHTPSLSVLNVPTTQAAATTGNARNKYTRLSNTTTTASLTTPNSLAAKRTRLDGVLGNTSNHIFNSNSSLPAGARGQNLVSLVSATDSLVPPASRRQTSNTGPARSTPDQSTNNSSVRNRIITSTSSRPTNVSTNNSNQNSQLAEKKPNALPNRPQSSNHSLGSDHSSTQQSNRTTLSTKADSPRSSTRSHSEDILICGRCRRLFEQVDELISHKMAGCSLDKDNGASCRCRAVGEPESLECAYCGANFSTAWGLMHHCHSDHFLTIYALPSPPASPTASPDSLSSLSSVSHRSANNEAENLSEKSLNPKSNGRLNIKREHSAFENHHSSSSNSADENHENSDWNAEEDDENNDQSGGETPTLESCFNEKLSPPSVLRDHSCDQEDTRSTPGASDSEESSEIGNKRLLKSRSPPCPRRSRGSEYGRHETVEDDDYVDDDSESINTGAE